MCSPVNAAARCRPRASARCSNASAGAPVCPSPSSRTCCATPAATPWPMRDTTRGRCRLGSGTKTSSTRCATPSWRRIDSRISGDRAPRDPTQFRTGRVNRAKSKSYVRKPPLAALLSPNGFFARWQTSKAIERRRLRGILDQRNHGMSLRLAAPAWPHLYDRRLFSRSIRDRLLSDFRCCRRVGGGTPHREDVSRRS
jgi:hypothetical protein